MPHTVKEQPCESFMPMNGKTGAPLALAMQQLLLGGTITPAGSRLVVKHTFASADTQPVEVVYAFALPRDAALRSFTVRGPGYAAQSELRPVAEATAAYELGIEQGHLAVLARTYRDGMVNLSVGNVKQNEHVMVILEIIGGVDLTDTALRFRFPFTIAPGYHARARHTTLAPGLGLTELPADVFGDVLMPPIAVAGTPLHEVGFDVQVIMPQPVAQIGSQSHQIEVEPLSQHTWRVRLAVGAEVPDRDLVLDVRQDKPYYGLLAGPAIDGVRDFAAIIAAAQFGAPELLPRRIVFLVDCSGSMDGEPMAQAQRAVLACLGALNPHDSLGFIAFNHGSRAFRDVLAPADDTTRAALRVHVGRLKAGGGTELLTALEHALRLLQGAQGDILVLTDGQVTETEPIVKAVAERAARIHCLGIGSASQDRFLTHLARHTGGASRFMTPRERVDQGVLELFSAIGCQVAVDVVAALQPDAEGTVEPAPPTQVLAGRPLVVYGTVSAAKAASLVVAWQVGKKTHGMEHALAAAAEADGPTLKLARGARLISDLEAICTEADLTSRSGKRMAARLVNLARAYGLANRCMALVAVVKRAGDRAGALPRTEIVPLGMAHGTDPAAYFGTPGRAQTYPLQMMLHSVCSLGEGMAMDDESPAPPAPRRGVSQPDADDTALELAGALLADGGMPGADLVERMVASMLAVLVLHTHDLDTGARLFTRHIARLVSFIEGGQDRLEATQQAAFAALIAQVRSGQNVPGDWTKRAQQLRADGTAAIRRITAALLKAARPSGKS